MTEPDRPEREGLDDAEPQRSDPLPGGRAARRAMSEGAGRALLGAETLVPLLVFVLVMIGLAMAGGFGETTTAGVLVFIMAFIAALASHYALKRRRARRP